MGKGDEGKSTLRLKLSTTRKKKMKIYLAKNQERLVEVPREKAIELCGFGVSIFEAEIKEIKLQQTETPIPDVMKKRAYGKFSDLTIKIYEHLEANGPKTIREISDHFKKGASYIYPYLGRESLFLQGETKNKRNCKVLQFSANPEYRNK